MSLRFALLAGVGLTVIGVGALVLVLIGRDGSDGDRPPPDGSPRVAAAESGSESRDGPGGIEVLDPGPLSVRGDVAVVGTDREVVVWGGDVEALNMGLPGPDRALADGAAYDPETGSWRVLTPSPLPDTPDRPLGVWTGHEVVFFRDRAAAAWNPDSDAWRALPEAAAGPVIAAAWTGNEIVTFPGPAALDPATGTWRDLPPPAGGLEVGGYPAVARWTGSELLVVTRGTPSPGQLLADAVGAAYNPETNEWRALPPSGIDAQALAGDWNGRELVVANYDMSAAAYDPATDRWRALPPVPARFSEWTPLVTSSGHQTAVFMSQTLAILDSNDRWTPLPYGEIRGARQPVVVGGVLYVFGFDYAMERNAFAAVDLDALVRNVGTLQVGSVSLTLPQGADLTRARFDRYQPVPGLPPAETVTAEITGAPGDCSVRSTYVGTFGELALDLTASAERTPVTITPVDGSASWTGVAGRDPNRTIVRLDGSDLIEVSCTEAGQAGDLARYIGPPPEWAR